MKNKLLENKKYRISLVFLFLFMILGFVGLILNNEDCISLGISGVTVMETILVLVFKSSTSYAELEKGCPKVEQLYKIVALIQIFNIIFIKRLELIDLIINFSIIIDVMVLHGTLIYKNS